MAIESLDQEYLHRLGQPGTYGDTTEYSMAAYYATMYSLATPKKFGHALLLFGNFETDDEISCQPWVTSFEALGEDLPNDALHSFAINEIKDGVPGFAVNDYVYKTPQDKKLGVIDQSWSGYVWQGDETSSQRFTLVVPDFYTSYNSHLLADKMDAVAATTERRGVLADHSIYISNMLVANGEIASHPMH